VLARELANDRADYITPAKMEEIARSVAETHKLGFRVLHVDDLKARNLTLLTAVGQGATVPPRLVILEYTGPGAAEQKPIAFVGKGVTFDTGGLNLKPTGSMESMYLDMSGSAAVLSAIKAVALLQLPIKLVVALALAENAIDGNAYKPHVILQTKKGSVEVSNTDAEGRLCLADAFTVVQEDYKVTQLVDIATLTGACVVALGECAAGLFVNDDKLAPAFIQAGKDVFERCWHLPILPEHVDDLKCTYSDFKSCGKGREAGASTAAAFLQKFIDEGVEWAHLDIAGPAMYSKPRGHMPEGGTGFGVQLLVQYLQSRCKKSS